MVGITTAGAPSLLPSFSRITRGYRRRSPAPPYPIFRNTLPLTGTSLPLSRDAARRRVSPLARAHPPPSPATRAAPDAAARMCGEVVSSSPCGHADHPRTTETPSRTSDLTAITESGEDAGCAMHTRWRRPGIALAPREVRRPKLLRHQNLSPPPQPPRSPPQTPPLLRCHHPDARIVHTLSRTLALLRDPSQLLPPISLGPDAEAFCPCSDIKRRVLGGDADGGSRALRNDCEWAPHITTTTPIFRDAAALHRPRIFALRNEEREIPLRPAHLYIYCTARDDAHRSLPSRCLERAGFRQQICHGLPRGSLIWSSAIRRGAIELLVAGERRCSPGALREKRQRLASDAVHDGATRARKGLVCACIQVWEGQGG
ncbi:hypothetical protein C8J57DRAFT_1729826 [Mycena rebaudengoi]|nr:hypothetical protein C8J57DRAFT_1729826 [Mycena rebaudengoi]